jgi:ribonuclease-3 family protein
MFMDTSELLKRADGASLAYFGDCVFELWVRERLLRSGLTNTGALNAASHDFVTAKNQSAAFHRIADLLTEEETAYFKRGRNSTHLSAPKSASGAEYRTATGFEALCAALWLSGQHERLYTLLTAAFPNE